jgi:hypothetical protein
VLTLPEELTRRTVAGAELGVGAFDTAGDLVEISSKSGGMKLRSKRYTMF